MRISNVSFQGIKVTKPQQNINTTQRVRGEQRRILDFCKEQLEFLEECENSQQERAGVGDDLFVTHSFPQISDLWTNSQEKCNGEREEIKARTSIFDKKMLYADHMIKVVRDSVAKIKAADRHENAEEAIVLVSPDNKGIKKIAGYKPELDVIQREFIDRVNVEKQGQDVDIFGSILFFGPYSNGKTYITKTVANSTDSNIVSIRHNKNVSKEQTMETIKEEAQKSEERFIKDRTRTIIFIDEVDKLIGKKSTVSKEFEEFIKTCSKKYHCSVFAATNNPLDLSVDMSDPDVFPIKMSIDPPDEENMAEVFIYYLADKNIEDVDYKKIVAIAKKKEEETGSKFSIGQIKSICDNIFFNKQGRTITMDDIIDSILSADPEITSELDAKFRNDFQKLIEA